ncbi:unnamed protein product, partial [Notodromas monacha]
SSSEITFDYRNELSGHALLSRLHGGVSFSVLDAAGGMVSMLAVYRKLSDKNPDDIQKMMTKYGTMDMRIDYLQSAIGQSFIAKAHLIKCGKISSITQMELFNEDGQKLCIATVYDLVIQIPYGKVSTYGIIAEKIGLKSSARMVGWAMNAAHNRPEIPAHRVVNRNGQLTGKHHFATPSLMQTLLENEG